MISSQDPSFDQTCEDPLFQIRSQPQILSCGHIVLGDTIYPLESVYKKVCDILVTSTQNMLRRALAVPAMKLNPGRGVRFPWKLCCVCHRRVLC